MASVGTRSRLMLRVREMRQMFSLVPWTQVAVSGTSRTSACVSAYVDLEEAGSSNLHALVDHAIVGTFGARTETMR